MKLTFEKDPNNEWYIVLPDWTGDRADLQMVCGADTFLDMIAKEEKLVSLEIESELTGDKGLPSFFLAKRHDTPEIGGAMYYIASFHDQDFEMWLCDVTRFVFNGELPQNIYVYNE